MARRGDDSEVDADATRPRQRITRLARQGNKIAREGPGGSRGLQIMININSITDVATRRWTGTPRLADTRVDSKLATATGAVSGGADRGDRADGSINMINIASHQRAAAARRSRGAPLAHKPVALDRAAGIGLAVRGRRGLIKVVNVIAARGPASRRGKRGDAGTAGANGAPTAVDSRAIEVITIVVVVAIVVAVLGRGGGRPAAGSRRGRFAADAPPNG